MEPGTLQVASFRMLVCARCGREAIHAVPPAVADSLRSAVCSRCEPGTFERLALEAGRHELVR